MANVPYIGANGNQVNVSEILLPDGKWYPLKPNSFSLFMDHAKDESGKPFPGSESLCFTAEMEETGESLTGPYISIQAMKAD